MTTVSLSNNTLNYSAIQANMSKSLFATSIDVVREASGLSLETIQTIAREQGAEINDTACGCVDQKLLAAVAEAYVRKMKAYFNNLKKRIAELDCEELSTFVGFCTTFKNRQSQDTTAQTWSDIDTDALREQFTRKVQILSDCLSFFPGCYYTIKNFDSIGLDSYDIYYIREFLYRDRIVSRVLHSRLFYEKPSRTDIPCLDIRFIVRRITLSARYHIFTSDDDDHQQATRDKFIINRAPAMVA